MSSRAPLRRLRPFDVMFLRLETPQAPCHFGGLAVLEGGALLDDEGRLRLPELAARIERRLSLVPQLRRRVLWPGPLGGRPVWVDDERFAIERHVHETRVPPPGGERELLETAARVYGPVLDRGRPLWELWFLTGMRDGRVGALLKLHHAVADGMAAVAVLASLFDVAPDVPDPAPSAWQPEPAPTRRSIRADDLSRKADALGGVARDLRRPGGLERAGASLARTSRLARSYAGANRDLRAPRTSLNRPVGAGRVVRVVALDLAAVKEVAHAHDAKVNDVVLDLWLGGMRTLLASRGERLPAELVASIPVSLRAGDGPRTVDNQSGFMATALPAREPDPVRRLALVADRTRRIKAGQDPEAIAAFLAAVAATPIGRAYTRRQRTSNTIVTNVPGPPAPVYLLGARIEQIWPIIGLVGNIGLICCAFSYTGRLSLVVTADATTFPDLDVLIDGIDAAWHGLSPDRHASALHLRVARSDQAGVGSAAAVHEIG
ncbi:MAG: wax ester/triacylglycerol synthase family O-acyltransferase [Planctomycetaceae bacterium]